MYVQEKKKDESYKNRVLRKIRLEWNVMRKSLKKLKRTIWFFDNDR